MYTVYLPFTQCLLTPMCSKIIIGLNIIIYGPFKGFFSKVILMT